MLIVEVFNGVIEEKHKVNNLGRIAERCSKNFAKGSKGR